MTAGAVIFLRKRPMRLVALVRLGLPEHLELQEHLELPVRLVRLGLPVRRPGQLR